MRVRRGRVAGKGRGGWRGGVGECELEYRAQSFNGVSQQCRCKADVITIRNHSAQTGTVPHTYIYMDLFIQAIAWMSVAFF